MVWTFTEFASTESGFQCQRLWRYHRSVSARHFVYSKQALSSNKLCTLTPVEQGTENLHVLVHEIRMDTSNLSTTGCILDPNCDSFYFKEWMKEQPEKMKQKNNQTKTNKTWLPVVKVALTLLIWGNSASSVLICVSSRNKFEFIYDMIQGIQKNNPIKNSFHWKLKN